MNTTQDREVLERKPGAIKAPSRSVGRTGQTVAEWAGDNIEPLIDCYEKREKMLESIAASHFNTKFIELAKAKLLDSLGGPKELENIYALKEICLSLYANDIVSGQT